MATLTGHLRRRIAFGDHARLDQLCETGYSDGAG